MPSQENPCALYPDSGVPKGSPNRAKQDRAESQMARTVHSAFPVWLRPGQSQNADVARRILASRQIADALSERALNSKCSVNPRLFSDQQHFHRGNPK